MRFDAQWQGYFTFNLSSLKFEDLVFLFIIDKSTGYKSCPGLPHSHGSLLISHRYQDAIVIIHLSQPLNSRIFPQLEHESGCFPSLTLISNLLFSSLIFYFFVKFNDYQLKNTNFFSEFGVQRL